MLFFQAAGEEQGEGEEEQGDLEEEEEAELVSLTSACNGRN